MSLCQRRNLFRPFSLFLLIPLAAAFSLSACAGSVERLKPRAATELRLEEIAALVEQDPARAVHLASAFDLRYGKTPETAELIRRAALSLEQTRQEAVKASEIDKALSLSRSLRALALVYPDLPITGLEEEMEEAEWSLIAKDLADGETVRAFVAAAKLTREGKLKADQATVLLEAAFKNRLRGSAEFFLEAALAAGAELSQEWEAYARGEDAVSDMVKGVATVWVDRGLRIEKGRAYPDLAVGSAFFIDKRGRALTNYHVVSSEVDPEYEGYSRVYLRLGDQSSPRIPAKVVAWDPILDLALLEAPIDPEYIFSVVGAARPGLGESVFAIGSPAGFERTLTAGIVSATGRRLLQLADVDQIDAAVNLGNSGGPLVDSRGFFAGIVFAGVEGFEGLNFSLPARHIQDCLSGLYRGGKLERSWLGLSVYKEGGEVRVSYVHPKAPTADYGLFEAASLKTINGLSGGIEDFQDALMATRPSELINVVVDGKQPLLIAAATRPDSPLASAIAVDRPERMVPALYGLLLGPSGSDTWEPVYLVRQVIDGSEADTAGLSENDPVSIRSFSANLDLGVAFIDLFVKKRRLGYLETTIRLAAPLDRPNLL